MSLIKHPISIGSNTQSSKKLNTSLKVGVTLISSVILASCGLDSSSTAYYTQPTTDIGSDGSAEEDKEAADKKAADQMAADEKAAADKKVADQMAADEKATADKEAADQLAADEKTAADKETADQLAADEKAAADKKVADQLAADEKAAADKEAADQLAADEKAAADKEAADQLAADEKAAADKKVADQLAADEKAAADKEAADQLAADEKAAADKEAADQLAADEKAAAEEAAEEAAADARLAESKAAADKAMPDTEITGFQSNTLSSKKGAVTDDAIGYAEIRNDKSDYTETQTVDGAVVPIDNGQGDNFTSYDKVTVRADMTKPDSVKEKVEINISSDSDSDYGNGFKLHTESTKVQGPVALDLNYTSVYKNFDSQMQIGHIYGNPRTDFFNIGDAARVSTVFVQGNATNLEDIKYLKELAQYNIDNNINDGMVSYTGVATYMENLHLKDGVRGGPVVDGVSNFNVDFVNNSVKGELAFEGDLKYNPTGKIGIEATIDGNTFAGSANKIDTAGGFYGEEAQFLGGIYQQALARGGKGEQPGEGTTFQGTFGAEKQ
ncbi:transferrin-binding protein-like solute binding protein [Psychrobacter sp. FDAARGOS_221]|uniref:transferrin-binding protein-like solute binding protein n=1 Tax=Psychrobacter sp. FDAARGOS_221 TaxID=1975705 RepID=UPI000BB570B5|nr:transferrin-binding protein-like solute binding protein [Psychrobacter sp. FDAARGOS_221]PNK61226.1 hypothetical protein A6J60_010315 [Psychrobacter sp. FDAARGOS_221]